MGATDGNRKIHRKSWDAMTKHKKQGGYGFRELQAFNYAMLSKSAAMLLAEPNALWVRFLKELYSSNTEFMHAVKGGRPSWAWESIINGRDVLKDNGVWSLGNVRSIRPFTDP